MTRGASVRLAGVVALLLVAAACSSGGAGDGGNATTTSPPEQEVLSFTAPRLGGALADLSPMVQQVILRGFAALSSLVTGTIVGAIGGLIAWAVSRPSRNRRERGEIS